MNVLYRGGLLITLLLVLCIPVLAADSASEGSSQGWYVIHCNVPSAKVYLDDKYMGETRGTGGTLTVPVNTTNPPKTLRVQMHGYSSYVSSITTVPDKGGSIDLYATLNQLSDTTQEAVGGDIGWYAVHCNIDGATVTFDGANKGDIYRGVVYVPVYSTGTPYRQYSVSKEGYAVYTSNLPTVPDKGQIIDLYATLNPEVTTAPTTPQPARTVSDGNGGGYTVHCNIDGATVMFDNQVMGEIAQGNLSVKYYATDTPYKTFRVYKAGYNPYFGTIDTYPTKGGTVDLYAPLTAQSGTTVTPTKTQKSPFPLVISGLALVLSGFVATRGLKNRI